MLTPTDGPVPLAPRLSVVICTYTEERWHLLCEGVTSVRNQTLAPHEVIVVVDHNDSLKTRARKAFPDARVVENEHEEGLSGARNTGVRHATGDIVVFLDDDARAEATWLSRLATPYLRPDVVGTGGEVVPRWQAQLPRWLPAELNWIVGCSYLGLPDKPTEVRNPLGANMSFRREALERTGGFTEAIGRIGKVPFGCEETELAIRVRRETGGTVLYLPSARVEHFVPSTRTTWRYFAARCWSEGLSKALVVASVGTKDALSSERKYVARTLPRGILRCIVEVAHGDAYGLLRVLAVAAALGVTTVGYATGRLASSPRARSARRAHPRPLRSRGRQVAAPAAAGTIQPRTATISAVVCTHDADRWEGLRRAVESLQQQTREVAEVLVVVDHNPPLFERARHELSGGAVVENRHARGLSGARNTALELARGEFVAFLDDDATAAPDWIERLARHLGDERVLGVGGRVVPRWLGARPPWLPDEFLWVVGCTYKGAPTTTSRVRNPFGGCFCIRRDVAWRVGGFRAELGRIGSNAMGCEETELCIRAATEFEGDFWYEPAAVIAHDVPRNRANWTYFRARCFSEGMSKAQLSSLVGRTPALSTERTYIRTALTAAVGRGVFSSLTGKDRWGVVRAAAVIAGLGVTAGGYVWGSTRAVARPSRAHHSPS